MATHCPCKRLEWTTERGTRIEVDQHNIWSDKNGALESVGTINSYGAEGFGVTIYSRPVGGFYASRLEAMFAAAREMGFYR